MSNFIERMHQSYMAKLTKQQADSKTQMRAVFDWIASISDLRERPSASQGYGIEPKGLAAFETLLLTAFDAVTALGFIEDCPETLVSGGWSEAHDVDEPQQLRDARLAQQALLLEIQLHDAELGDHEGYAQFNPTIERQPDGVLEALHVQRKEKYQDSRTTRMFWHEGCPDAVASFRSDGPSGFYSADLEAIFPSRFARAAIDACRQGPIPAVFSWHHEGLYDSTWSIQGSGDCKTISGYAGLIGRDAHIIRFQMHTSTKGGHHRLGRPYFANELAPVYLRVHKYIRSV